MRKIVIAAMEISGKSCIACALQEEGVIWDLRIYPFNPGTVSPSEDDGHADGGTVQAGFLGNIYVGEVENISENMQMAFIRFQPDRRCCLRLSETDDLIYVSHKKPGTPLKPGDQILIRITKEAMKGKQASGSAELSVAGRYLVMSSKSHEIGVSRKLDQETRERLKELLSSQNSSPYSVIVRTNAAEASSDAILHETSELTAVLDDILRKGVHRSLYSCLYSPPDPVLTFVRDMWKTGTEIVTDTPLYFERIRELFPIRFYSDKLLPLYNLYGLKSVLEEALQERVWLKSGGFIVIQPTEACTVIDVNTGKNIQKKDKEKTFLDTNLEAAHEIARQIQIRNLSGIILVDFINMNREEDRENLMETMRALFRTDPDGPQVIDMTPLQIMEITRKKSRIPLYEAVKHLH